MINHTSANPDSPEALLLKAPQVARLLGISERKLWELANCGELPSIRIGRCRRYSRNSLEKWIEQQERRSR